jgi:hypothetical protein
MVIIQESAFVKTEDDEGESKLEEYKQLITRL